MKPETNINWYLKLVMKENGATQIQSRGLDYWDASPHFKAMKEIHEVWLCYETNLLKGGEQVLVWER